jgi:prepilin-type N-terminal cleavage/methylation domain-containing protein
MRKTTNRRGFTLPEVLVTVTIVAVLAAVMVPAVINQVSKGDVPSVSVDLSGIRTGITTFASDMRRFPARLSDMGGSSLASALTDINATAYGADTVSYHGPYLTLTTGHTGPTGAIFSNAFVVPAATSLICLKDSVNTNSLITSSQMVQMDKALDNNDGKATGLVKWTETVPGTVDAGTARICVTTK